MSRERVNYFSFINSISALAVVIMHANVSFWTYQKTGYWEFSNVLESTLYCAVPLFFMLSGATLMDYQDRYSTKEYFKKRFFKTVVPFLFWSVFSMFWASRKVIIDIFHNTPGAKLDWTVGSVIDGIFNTKFLHIYWFFIPLFGIYLIMPVFGAIEKAKRLKAMEYTLWVSMVVNFTVPFILMLLKNYAGFDMGWTITLFSGFQYLVYVAAGYVLSKKDYKLRYRLLIYFFALASLLTHILGTSIATAKSGALTVPFKNYYYLTTVLYSIGVFILLKKIGLRIKNEKVNRFFGWFQRYTFPVYLIHRYFLDVMEDICLSRNWSKASILYVLIATVVSLTLSVLLTMILRKIPVLRRIVP